MNRSPLLSIIAAALALTITVAPAQEFGPGSFDLSWNSVDGGGAMNTTGGTFELSGTAGQPDAGSFTLPMTGGGFTLVGGFWPAAASVCPLPGDMNLDTSRDGLDLQGFLDCLLGVSGGNCVCADFSANGSVGNEDIPGFVSLLLGL